LLVLVVAGCSSSHPPVVNSENGGPPRLSSELPSGAPHIAPGEHMSYRLSLKGVELAAYDMAVGDVGAVSGHRAIAVQSRARAVGFVKAVTNVDDTFTSMIDMTNGHPLVWTSDELEKSGEHKEKTEARIVDRIGDSVPITFRIDDGAVTPETQHVTMPDVWDFNALLVALRSWDAAPGSTVKIECFRSRYLWSVTMTARDVETITTGLADLGEVKARRFDGHAFKLQRDGVRLPNSEERDLSIWISSDADRVPLEMKSETDYGDIDMTIIDYAPGSATGPRS
jgi:hypothetical protein